jgi:hypothetical protein
VSQGDLTRQARRFIEFFATMIPVTALLGSHRFATMTLDRTSSNDLRWNNDRRWNQCKNDLRRKAAWRRPLKHQSVPTSTRFKSCPYFILANTTMIFCTQTDQNRFDSNPSSMLSFTSWTTLRKDLNYPLFSDWFAENEVYCTQGYYNVQFSIAWVRLGAILLKGQVYFLGVPR